MNWFELPLRLLPLKSLHRESPAPHLRSEGRLDRPLLGLVGRRHLVLHGGFPLGVIACDSEAQNTIKGDIKIAILPRGDG